jgi:hypothetical protein
MRLLTILVVLAALTSAVATAAQGEPDRQLEAILGPTASEPAEGFGLVKFRQPKDEQAVVYLDVWVRDLLPSHTYNVERAVDTTQDDACSGSNWKMPVLGTITTDVTGTGRATLTRPLPPTAIGTHFDIHFRIVDLGVGPDAAVLQSGCYQFTGTL